MTGSSRHPVPLIARLTAGSHGKSMTVQKAKTEKKKATSGSGNTGWWTLTWSRPGDIGAEDGCLVRLLRGPGPCCRAVGAARTTATDGSFTRRPGCITPFRLAQNISPWSTRAIMNQSSLPLHPDWSDLTRVRYKPIWVLTVSFEYIVRCSGGQQHS